MSVPSTEGDWSCTEPAGLKVSIGDKTLNLTAVRTEYPQNLSGASNN